MLRELVSLYGPSGREGAVADYIENKLKPYADVSRDSMGNVIAHIKGEGKKLMLAAHMDEIGIMVTYIEDKGFLRFVPVGGLSPMAVLYQKVKFKNGVIGVIACSEDIEPKDMKIKDMYIDIGADSKASAQKKVQIGDMAGFYSEFICQGDIVTTGKADDRIGCFMLLSLAEKIKNPSYDLYLVFTVQEEVGLRGATPSAFSVNPDIAIAVDVTDTGDTPSAPAMAVEMGKGIAIKIKDGRMVTSEEIVALLENTAKKENIPYQFEVMTAGTTDGSVIQTSREGVPTGVISVPCRYIHTPCETFSLKDVEGGISLLEKIINKG